MPKFELPKLPYAKDALAPYISAETLEYHHGKHHQSYVDNLNKLVAGTKNEGLELEALVKKSTGPLFNNAAQHWNHSFYWNSLSPEKNQSPSGPLAQAIDKTFGSRAGFEKQFTEAAIKEFGSGWAWLSLNPANKSLVIEITADAVTPLTSKHKPLFTCDVWEHAYYIDYRNARAKYIEAFWKVLNWHFAEKNFKENLIPEVVSHRKKRVQKRR
jgi:superoxide dismutase, Fe-Mn family